jgi:hypothetical protein
MTIPFNLSRRVDSLTSALACMLVEDANGQTLVGSDNSPCICNGNAIGPMFIQTLEMNLAAGAIRLKDKADGSAISTTNTTISTTIKQRPKPVHVAMSIGNRAGACHMILVMPSAPAGPMSWAQTAW